MELPVELEVGKGVPHPSARWVSLKIGGVEVFSELVYDTNEHGDRTDEQARLNFLRVFASRFRESLEKE